MTEPDCDLGEPLDVPAMEWTYVPVDGTQCAFDGTAGFFVNPSATSDELLIVLEGGGACFNEGDCQSSMLYGFDPIDAMGPIEYDGLFDRSSASNPFSQYSYVYVPYCTGDFHSGANASSYGARHVGYTNMQAFLTRIVPTFCDASHVMLTGFSAGGFGATFNYAQVHDAFGSATPVDLIDDSGPYMPPPWMPIEMQADIDDNWGFRANMPPDCTECEGGWHALYPYLSARYPNDRISLVSALFDFSIQERFAPYTPLDTLESFEPAINALADEVLVPLPNVRVYYIYDNGHVYLPGALDDLVVSGVSLEQFVRSQIDDDPGWSNVRP